METKAINKPADSTKKKVKPPKPVNSAASRKLFAAFYERNRLSFTLALILAALSSADNSVVSWILGSVIDAIGASSRSDLSRAAIATAIFLPAYLIVDSLFAVIKSRFVHRGIAQYKTTAFSMLCGKGIGAFSRENTGGYLSALTNDAATIEENYLNRTVSLVFNVLRFAFALGMMLYYSPLMTLIVIGLCLVPIIATLAMGGGLTKREKTVSDKNEAFTSRVKDLLGGFSVIKAFKAEKQANALFSGENAEVEESKRSRRTYSGILNALSGVSGGVVQFGIFIIGAIFAINGRITAGTVILFVNLCNCLIGPISVLPEIIASRGAAKALVYKLADKLEDNQSEAGGEVIHSLERGIEAKALVYKLADKLEDNQSEAGGEVINSLERGIEVKALGFGYEEDKPVLHNLSCRFEAGKKYALVGFSGSGKTTLLNLMMGAYADYSGSLKVGGVELKNADTGSLYESVSLINQSVFLFDDTIRNNITMFSKFPKDEVDSAIRRAGLERVIAERGEEYLCGENGVNLSGGERQRISIARALIKNASVLLVDEATSALDNETASLVSNEILKLDGITGIVVTHRLEASLLKKYDAILMLKNGSLAEVGSFDELMEKKGQFYSLFTVQ